jgi:phosphoenolpyruvate-protein phosphotransferase (PTS system enzyme I)
MESETASPRSHGPNGPRDDPVVRGRTLAGKPVSPGYARGHAVFLGQDQREIPRRKIPTAEVEQELERFRLALETSRAELHRLSNRLQSELGMAEAEIFSAHLLFLQDPHFIERVEAAVREDLINIEAAIDAAIAELAQLLREADDAYLREREEDVRDLGRRVLRHVVQRELQPLARLEAGSVIIARELLPSDLLEIDRAHLAGIITERGGEAGHAAILARALAIPAVTGVTEVTRYARTGAVVLLDGLDGAVVLNPTEEQTRAFLTRQVAYEEVSREARLDEQLECVTTDGVRISLYANLGREDEVAQVAAHCLDGIGLFRTEYLFLTQSRPPSFEQQRQLYQSLAGGLGGKPLVIRTLDLGGDKYPAFQAPQFETNPNLGLRGLRFSLLVARDLFCDQVRAIIGLYPALDVSILLPMVLGGADLRAALTVIREVATEERVAALPPIGALIETPSAVFAIDDILAQADFVSIGTNDLTQFILAADRNALSTMDDYTVLHPSVLRAMRLVIRAADAAGKPASVCGEAAGDPDIAQLLVGLGVRRLSMSPVTASRVRSAIRASAYGRLQEMAEVAVAFDSAEAVAALLGRAPQDPL